VCYATGTPYPLERAFGKACGAGRKPLGGFSVIYFQVISREDMSATTFKNIPVIETERLTLRAFSLDDIPAYRKEFEKEAVQRYLGGVLIVKDDTKSAQNWLRNINDRLLKQKLVFTWLITQKEDVSESIGRIDLGGFTNKKVGEVSYYIWEKYWGHGFAGEALRRVVEFGFNDLKLERIQAIVDVRNTASEKVLVKAGFEKEGMLRKYPLGRGIADVYMFAKVK
jgi:ribosomal-protein-alanine N-acetyltransferase